MSRRWVADASPIILLAKTGHVGLLASCSEELLVPETVAEEVRQAGEDDPARKWLEAEGAEFVGPAGPIQSKVAAWDLGRGESRVLSYGLRHPEWTVVVDDGAARRCAQGLDISLTGTLGLLVVAKRDGRLDRVRPVVGALEQAGLHVDEALIRHVLETVDED